jgi:NAD(P)-dependent dehydrogenase (short-subunit alcohol dehydrogenase family)
VVLITGASSGIGFVSARELARAGARVFIACRSESRAREAASAIEAASGHRVQSISLDLADLASVRRAAEDFQRRARPHSQAAARA